LNAEGININNELLGASKIDEEGEVYYVRISDGKAVIPLWNMGRNGYARFTGSGSFEMLIIIWDKEKGPNSVVSKLFYESVRISNGNAIISYIDADEINER